MSDSYEATYKSLYFDYPLFDSPIAPEIDGSEPIHDVIVVGAGPVGLATALDLAQRGIKVVLLEAETTIGIGSRAGSLSRRSVEYLASLGIGDELLAQGMVYDAGWTYFRDREIFRLSIPGQPGDQFPPMLKIQQCYIEKYLADRANQNPNIEVRWGHRMNKLDNGPDHVELDVTCPHGAYRTRARYVVGADGGRSDVRKQIGQHLGGKTFSTAFVVADLKMEADLPVGRRMWYDPPWNPGGSVIMHLQPENIWRFDYSLPAGVDEAEELKPEQVAKRVADHLAWLGWDTPWELDWMTLYRAHMRIVDHMRVGRTLLAGDAAHLIPIFGVRGLNGGLADASNLGWKLARVVRGQSPATLLDSYDDEQHQVFAGNVAAADLSTRFVCPANAAARVLRDATLHLAQVRDEYRPLLDPRQSQAIPLYDSTLIENQASHGALRPGDALPNLRFTGDTGAPAFLNDLLGPDFTVIALTKGSEMRMSRRVEHVGEDSVEFLEVVLPDGAGGELGDHLRGTTVLVRPDRYVAASWPTATPTQAAVATSLRLAAGREGAAA